MSTIYPNVDVESYKRRAIEKLNVSAESARASCVTCGATQLSVYREKEQEARACLRGAAPDDTPYLTGEARQIGTTRRKLARVVVERADECRRVFVAIEAERQRRLKEIKAAATLRDVTRAATVAWDEIIENGNG